MNRIYQGRVSPATGSNQVAQFLSAGFLKA